MATYRIGLAMAGAVSAGAYSAGVLDFLIEALDAWYDAKARGDAVPMHDVSVVVSSGASAGSMCSALLAVALPYAFSHIRLDSGRKPSGNTNDNPFYRAWVDRIRIEALLDSADVGGGRLRSYLNSSSIDEILKETLAYTGAVRPRPWVAQPFLTRLSVGNLRGVPYRVTVLGTQSYADEMIEHADHMSFSIGPVPLPPSWTAKLDDHVQMPPHDAPRNDDARRAWELLGESAVASGAFPLFLQPRKLSRPSVHYDYRHSFGDKFLKPDWGGPAPESYAFVCMDGGIFNNEPFDLAHSALLLVNGRTSNPRPGDDADACILMIDPFVSGGGVPAEINPEPLEGLIGPLLSAWTMQARFRPQDLALAHDPNVFSRYLVSPSRSGTPPTAGAHPLACGGLSGFFGFFHHEFRKHDYQLGRRNCQRFLMEHFTVPDGNKVVGPGYAHLDAAARARFSTQDKTQIQIIPVMPPLQVEEASPAWPAGLLDLGRIQPLLKGRIDAVYEHYRDRVSEGRNWFVRKGIQGYLWTGWKLGGVRDRVIGTIMQRLRKAQTDQGL